MELVFDETKRRIDTEEYFMRAKTATRQTSRDLKMFARRSTQQVSLGISIERFYFVGVAPKLIRLLQLQRGCRYNISPRDALTRDARPRKRPRSLHRCSILLFRSFAKFSHFPLSGIIFASRSIPKAFDPFLFRA